MGVAIPIIVYIIYQYGLVTDRQGHFLCWDTQIYAAACYHGVLEAIS